jgi:predicted DNA-binding transcriptional regulator YafY
VKVHEEIADSSKRTTVPDPESQQLKNGDVIVSFQASGMDEIVSWVLLWGSYATTLSPPELKTYIHSELGHIADNYELKLGDQLKRMKR